MDDLISRAKAIEAFNTNLNELVVGGEENAKTVENYLNRVLDKIKYLPSALGTNLAEVGTDCISRQDAIEAIRDMQAFDDDNGQPYLYLYDVMATFMDEEELPPIQPEIVRCEDCKYWHSGSCEYPEYTVNSQDYMIGDIETEAEHFCGYAEKREVTT